MRIPYAYLKQQTWLYRRTYPRALLAGARAGPEAIVEDRRRQAGQGTGGRGQLLAQVRIAANALAFYSRLWRRFDVILGLEGVHFGVCSERPVIDIISLTFEKPACLLPGWAQMIWQSHSVEHSRLAHCCFGRICINVGNIAGVLGYGFLLFCCWYA